MARLTAIAKELTEHDIAALIDIGAREVKIIDAIETALVAGDTQAVIDLAWKLVKLDKTALDVGAKA